MLNFMLKELDQVGSNRAGSVILGGVRLRLIGIVGLNNGDNLFRVDGDMRSSDPVLGAHDEVGLAVRGQVGHGDVVQSFERGSGSVDLDDDLVGHLDEFGGGTDTGAGNDTAILSNG